MPSFQAFSLVPFPFGSLACKTLAFQIKHIFLWLLFHQIGLLPNKVKLTFVFLLSYYYLPINMSSTWLVITI